MRNSVSHSRFSPGSVVRRMVLMGLSFWFEYICRIIGTDELIKAQVLFFLKALKQHEDMLIYLNLHFKFISSKPLLMFPTCWEATIHIIKTYLKQSHQLSFMKIIWTKFGKLVAKYMVWQNFLLDILSLVYCQVNFPSTSSTSFFPGKVTVMVT